MCILVQVHYLDLRLKVFSALRSAVLQQPICLFTAAGSQWDRQLLENRSQMQTPSEVVQWGEQTL